MAAFAPEPICLSPDTAIPSTFGSFSFKKSIRAGTAGSPNSSRAYPAARQRLSGSARDVEGQYSKAWSREAFQKAFAQAMSQLSPRDKSLLRLHYLDSVTIDQLGGLYRTHRATAARWLAMARQRLLDGTRAALTAELQIPLADCDSIIQAAQSQLDMTFHRLFAR